MFHKSKLSTTYLLETTTDIPKDCRSSICSNNLTNPNSWVNYIQRFKINMFVLRRGFFIYGKRVYISSTQSIQTSVQLWYVLVRLWIIWMTSYVSFFDPLSIKNVGPPARWVAVLAKFTANKPLFFATTNLTRLC